MYDIGDKIVYPMYGAGVIQAIEEREVFGEKANLRDVISAEEADRVLEAFKEIGRDENDNWNRRCRDNMTRIRGGDAFEVAFVVKSLMLRERERMLSTGERKMLTNARKILLSELSLAKNVAEEILEELLEGAV